MFYNDRLIYLQLQKSGGTHITKLLQEEAGGQAYGKHTQLRRNPKGLPVVGSIRNPWDWYVSLWGFFCAKKGLYKKLTSSHGKRLRRELKNAKAPKELHQAFTFWQKTDAEIPALWAGLCDSPYNAEAFRKWLKFLLSPKGKNTLLEGYPFSAVRPLAGFMTYRFLRLHTRYNAWKKHGKLVSTYENLYKFYKSHQQLDHVIHMESLADDLISVLRACGYNPDENRIYNSQKTNTSERGDWRSYYDKATSELVENEERLLVEEFGYQNPLK